MLSIYYNFSYEDMFYIITAVFYYIFIDYLFIQQQIYICWQLHYTELLTSY